MQAAFSQRRCRSYMNYVRELQEPRLILSSSIPIMSTGCLSWASRTQPLPTYAKNTKDGKTGFSTTCARGVEFCLLGRCPLDSSLLFSTTRKLPFKILQEPLFASSGLNALELGRFGGLIPFAGPISACSARSQGLSWGPQTRNPKNEVEYDRNTIPGKYVLIILPLYSEVHNPFLSRS